MSAARVDWSFGPGHGPVSGVVNAAGSALAATMIADLAHTQPLWGLVGGTVGAAGSVISAAVHNAPGAVWAYRAFCWMGAGGWSAWAMGVPEAGPWSNSALVSLAVGTLGAGLAGLGLQHAHRRDVAQAVDAAKAALAAQGIFDKAPDTEENRIAAKWQPLLTKISRKPVKVIGVKLWEPYTGFTLDVDLPGDGTTIDDIKPHEKALATAGDVPPGCAVEVLDGETGRRQILIRIGTIDALAADHHLPDDTEPDSINNDLSMGIRSDRTDATVNLRYNCMVLVGQTDSGKSNQLNVVTRRLAPCTDALILAIDESGNGRFPRPWVRAWAEGRASAPIISMVAPNPLWSLLMTQMLIQIIDGRTAEYGDLMFKEGSDKLMPRPSLPQLVLLVDEFGKLSDQVKDNIKTISDTGRGAAVRVVSCALEATSTYIPRPLIAQSRERVGMRVSDETQLQYLFDNTWKSGRFDPKSLIHKGSGLYSTDAGLPEKFKGWRMEPKRIDVDSITFADLRPELDDVSIDLGDIVTVQLKDPDGLRVEREFRQVWTKRWEKTLPIIFPSGLTGPEPSAPSRPTITVIGGTTVTEKKDTEVDLDSSNASLREALDAAQRAADEADAAARSTRPADLPGNPDDPEVARLNELWEMEPVEPDRTGSPPARLLNVHPRRRMRQLVVDAAKDGIGPGPVHETLKAEGYETVYQTVVDWMRADADSGVLAQPGGKKTAYFPGPQIGDPYRDGPRS